MQVLRCLTKQETLNLTISLGRGGEAYVYAVPTDGNLVAKIYHKPTEQHARKILAMLANPPENPTASLGHISIAWPYEPLKAVDSDRIIGFLMPRIRGMRPVIDFYNPRTRREHCPLFNYQYLLRTARNLAAAFAALHNSGYCVGDVNESNIMVSDTALVTLVDTDSFQVRDTNKNVVYRCQVGKPEFTPPELQNKIFAQYDRAVDHDSFGLAVLIFQLLMEGTHPFSGIYQGTGEPPTYEGRIANGHFTYSRNRRVPYAPTPIAPAWSTLPPSLQEMFIRCFEEGHNNPKMRPSAQTWLLELAEIENDLITCTANSQHRYSSHLHNCPWCERTLRLGGRDPFPSHQAIESKEHLQPRRQTRRRNITVTRANVPQVPVTHLNYRPSRPKNFSYYQPAKKSRFYPVILCLLGFGTLGYLDVMIKFTRPLVSQNYTQQTLMSRQEESKNRLSFAEYYKQGHAAYKVRNYDQALDNFSQAIQLEPKHAKVYINRGNARYNLKDYEGALKDYTTAIQINPTEVKAYVNRGNSRFMLAEYSSDPDKDYNLALTDFNNALRLNPSEAEAYVRRGIVRSQLAKYSGDSQQDYRLAIGDFNEALALNLGKAEAFYQRGVVRYQIGQYSSDFDQEYKQALSDFDQALSIDSRLAKVYLKRGIVRYKMSQYGGKESNINRTQAIADLQTSAKIFLEQEDMDNYQQALSSICVVLENKCDTFLESANGLVKGN